MRSEHHKLRRDYHAFATVADEQQLRDIMTPDDSVRVLVRACAGGAAAQGGPVCAAVLSSQRVRAVGVDGPLSPCASLVAALSLQGFVFSHIKMLDGVVMLARCALEQECQSRNTRRSWLK